MGKLINFKNKTVVTERNLTAVKLSSGKYLLTIKGYAKEIEIVFDDEEKMNNWINRFYRAL